MGEFEEEVKNAQLPSPAPGTPQDAFIFESISDLEIPPELDVFDEAIDPEYNAMLDRHARQINAYSPAPTGNYNSPYPGPVNPTYHPNQRRRSPNLTSGSGTDAYFKSLLATPVSDKKTLIADPIYGSIKGDNFDRYYEHGSFAELGFHPFRDNEQVYNQNSTIWSDLARMTGELGSLAGTSMASSYRSIFNPTATMDVQAAIEFEDAMRVGESTRGGFGSWSNNFLLQSGYTVGIIGQIALEEFAMWGGTAALAASGFGTAAAPVAGAAATARTGWNLTKLGRVIKNSFGLGRFASGTRAIFNGLNNADRARDYYSTLKAGGNVLGKVLAPETVRAFKSLNTAQNGVEGLNAIGKIAVGVGGMYRDIRSINFALAEGKMEAGSVFREHIMNDYAIQADKNMKAGLGNIVTEEQMKKIAERGSKAAFATTMGNAPVIYLSNQLLLGNAFGGFKRSLPQMFKHGLEGARKRVLKTGVAVSGKKGAKKVGKQVYEDIGESFLGLKQLYKTVKAGGAKGSLLYGAGGALRYFSANFSEGAQEVYQEALAHGVKDYYKAIAFDPIAGGIELLKTSVRSGVASQWSSEGFDVFMSGFLMGGVVSAPQKMVFQGMPMLYQKTFDKKGYKKYKDAKEEYYTKLTEVYNKGWDEQADLNDFFNADNIELIIQKQSNEAMENAQEKDSILNWQDSKDFARFQKMHTIFSSGRSSDYTQQLNDYLQLSDEELAEMWPKEKVRAKSGALRKSLQKQLDNIKKAEIHYEKNKDKMQNPNNPNDFKPGTRAHRDAVWKYKAYEHARYLYLFSQDGVRRAAERSASITEELASDSIFTYSSIQDVSASDITVLLHKDSLLQEIENLEKIIPGLGEAGTKRLKKQKETKLEKLKAIADVLYAEENLNKDGSFNRTKINKVAPLFIAYFQSLSKQKGQFLNKEAVIETIKKIIDKNHLDVRAGLYSKTVETLTNPEKLDEVIRSSYEYFKYAYENKIEIFKEQIKKYINKKEINTLLNQFLELGVYPDSEQVKKFGEDGDVSHLKDFFTKEGIVTAGDDLILFQSIFMLKSVYSHTAEFQEKAKEEKAQKAKEAKEKKTSSSEKVDNILSGAEIEGSDVIVYGKVKGEHPVIDEIIRTEWEQFQGWTADAGMKRSFSYFLKLQRPENLIAAYKGLKNLWEQVIKVEDKAEKDRIFKSDDGFLDWLVLQEANNLVQDIFSATNTKFTDFITDFERQTGTLETETKFNIIEGEGEYLQLVEVQSFDTTFGKVTSHFQIRDGKGQPLPDELIADLKLAPGLRYKSNEKGKAQAALTILKKAISDTARYEFGGMTLHYGMIVKDKKTGVEYVVIGEPGIVEKHGKVHLVPVKNLKKGQSPKTIRVKGKLRLSENQFRNKYTSEVSSLGTESLPDNVTKLRVDEAVTLRPHHNKGEESEEQSRIRFQAIISMLSSEELASLGVRVTKNENGGAVIRSKTKLGDKEPNPLIAQTRQSYSISLTIPEELMGKINSKLKNLGIEPSNRNILGYAANNDVRLFDRNGRVIDPLAMTMGQAKNLFEGPITEERLQEIKNNFAIQYTIMNIIQEKMGDGKEKQDWQLNSKLPIRVLDKNNDTHDIYEATKEQFDEARATGVESVYYKIVDQEGNIVYPETFEEYQEYLEDKDKQLEDLVEAAIKDDKVDIGSVLVPLKFGFDLPNVASLKRYIAARKEGKTNQTFGDWRTKPFVKTETNIAEFKLEEFGDNGADFYRTPGSMAFLKTGTDNPVSDLNTSTVDDEIVIITNERDKKGRISSSMKTTYEGTPKQQREFREKIEQEMHNQNVSLLKNAKASGARYVMIVKQGNGVYSYIPLKPDQMSDEEVNNMASELIDRSIKTVKENVTTTREDDTLELDETGEDLKVSAQRDIRTIKNNKYNAEWNKEFNDRFYITSSPGYSFSLNVVSNGGIELKVYDKNNKLIVAQTYQDNQLQIDSFKDSDNKSELLKDLFKQFESDIRIRLSKEKDDTKKKVLEEALKLKLDVSNIRKSFPRDAALSEIAEKSSTTIAPEIRGASKLNINISGINYLDVKSIVPITTKDMDSPVSKREDTPELGEDDVSVDNLSVANFTSYKEDDFSDLPEIYLKSIANKLVENNDVSKLSKAEQEVYNSAMKGAIELMKTIIAAEKNKGATNTTNTIKEKKKETSAITDKKADIEKKIQKEIKFLEDAVNDARFATNEANKTHWQKDLFENKLKQLKDALSKPITTGEQVAKLTLLLNSVRGALNTGISLGDPKSVELGTELEKTFQNIADEIIKQLPSSALAEYIDAFNDKVKTRGMSLEQDLMTYPGGHTSMDGKNQEYFLTKENVKTKINDKYDAELAALEEAPVKTKTTTKENKSELTNETLIKQLRIEINALKKEIESRQDQLAKELGPAKAMKAINTDDVIKKIKAQIKKKQSDLTKLSANKIISKTLESNDVDSIDSFLEWAADSLPDFISVEDIRELGNNMKSGGVRVGAFVMALNNIAGSMRINGKIYTGTSTKHAYHEAFHAVFRMLLTKEQQKTYYALAKKEVLAKLRSEGKSLKLEIEKLRNSDIEKYGELSKSELENLYYEEYMADEFEKFKQSPKKTKTTSFIKSLFNRIVEWIKSALGVFNANELQALYEDVSSGKFRTSNVAANPFTETAGMGITVDASKVIRTGEETLEDGTVVFTNLDEKRGRGIVNSITARVIIKVQENKDPNLNLADLVTESINKYRKLYNPENPIYQNIGETPGLFAKLLDINNAFDNYTDDFVDSVIEILELYDLKVKRVFDANEESENEYGLRTTSDWDKDASMTGGFRSLTNFLRRYMGTTTLVETVDGAPITDEFGNKYLDPETEEPLLTTVNFAEAYTGFLKAVSGKTDPIAILQQLHYFSENNPQTRAVVNRLFNDLGIKWEGQLEEGKLPGQTKNNFLFQAIIKGFENFRVEYLFIHTRKLDLETFVYSASNRDDAASQIDKWAQAYQYLFESYKTDPSKLKELSTTLEDLLAYLDPNTPQKKISDEVLKEEAVNMSKVFKNLLGISLHPNFIQYSISKNITEKTPYQKNLVEINKSAVAIRAEDISEIFIKVTREKDGKPDPAYLFSQNEEGVYNRFRRLALGNAVFDESVGVSVFKNAAGDLVYAHQLPTFHLKEIMALNDVEGDGKKLDEMREEGEFLAANALLDPNTNLGKAMKVLSAEGRIKISRISGTKSSSSIEQDENMAVTEGYDRNEEGTTYGDLDPQQFVQALLASYAAGFNQKTGRVEEVEIDNDTQLALAPVLLRVLEASSTGDMTPLPVMKAVEEDKNGNTVITDEALNTFVNRVEAELDRIASELDPTGATYNPNTGEGKLIPGYNADKSGQNYDKNGRAFKFSNTGNLLSPISIKVEKSGETLDVLHSPESVDRVRSGAQKIFFLSEGAASYNKFTIEGQTKNILLKGGVEVKQKGKKKPKFNPREGDEGSLHKVKLLAAKKKMTGEAQAHYIKNLGDALSAEKTAKHNAMTPKEAEKYRVKVDNGTSLWAEATHIAQFLNGYGAGKYVYEVVEDDATTTEEIQAEGFKERLEKSIEELVEAKEYVTLDSALKNMNSSREELKKFMSDRIDAEVLGFETELQEIVGDQIPKFIKTGITKAADSNATDASIAATNRKLNLTSNKSYNVKQIFISNWINTTAINDILLGDQAMTLKDAVDAVKRAKMQNAAFYSAKSVIGDPKNGIKPVSEITAFPLTEPQGKSIHTKKDIDVADAQMYMTANAFKHIWFGVGKLDQSHVDILNKIEAGEKVSVEEIFGPSGAISKQQMLNSKKFVYGDGKAFIKMSGFILTKQYTSYKNKSGEWVARPDREELHNMRVKMEKYEEENDTISISAPLSAFKMLKENVTPIEEFVSSDGKPLSKNQTMTLNAEFFGLQVLNPSNKMEMIDPTQIKNIVTGEQDDSVEVLIDGEKFSIGDIRERYHKGVSDRTTQKYLDKRNLIFSFDVDYAMDELHKSIDEDKITVDLLNYLEYAQTSLKSSQSAAQIIEFFTYDQDTGQQKYQLNNPIVKAKFEQLFLAYFKSALSGKIKGTQAALVSDKGVKVYRRVLSVDENGYPDKQEIIRSDAFLEEYSVSDLVQEGDKPLDFSDDDQFDRLKVEVEASKGKGVIILDRLRHNMKEYNTDGNYTGVKYSESLFPAHDANVMRDVADERGSSIPDVISKMFGVRIPSQAHHSAINIKVVDFLPAYYGSSIISSRELSEVSGSDFDIDKLYIHMKEYYQQDGGFFEYRDNFLDYVRYINTTVNKRGSIYAEANFKSTFGLDQSYTDAEMAKYREEGLSDNSINALGELGLPRTKAEYKAFKENHGRPPYTAPLDNQILDDKFILLGNAGLTEKKDGKAAIAYEPADIEVLTDLWDEIQEEFPELAELSNEEGLDANNMWGKWRSFNNNQEGAGSIGAAVLPNLFLSLMQENEVKFKFLEDVASKTDLTFNGIKYNKYTNKTLKGVDYAREVLEDKTPGRRKQYVISALITAMTDNAKDRMAKKLGLNINALGLVANMTALGVPIKTSIELVNNAILKDVYNAKKLDDKVNIAKMVGDKIGMLYALHRHFSDGTPVNLLRVNQDLLSESIKDPLPSFSTVEDFTKREEKGDIEVTTEQIETEISILNQFMIAHEISEYTSAMSNIINLHKGFGSSLQDMARVDESIKKLGLHLSDSEYNARLNEDKPLIDVRSIFKGKTWQANNLRVFNEFYNNLLPKVFLTQSKTFRNMYSAVMANAKSYLKKEDKAKLENDLLSYLTIQAYVHNGLVSDSQSIGSLNNDLLYPQESGKSIVDVVNEAKEIWDDNTDGKFNYFLEEYIISKPALQKGNKTGINIIASNTFSRLNESQRISLQNGFRELFNDPNTRGYAMKIIHYLMVKDGLQPAYESLLSALNPQVLSRYLGVIDNVQETFARKDPELMKSTFGLTYDELIKEYTENYFVAAKAARYAKRIELREEGKDIYDPRATVDIAPSNTITKRTVENNPDTLYVIFDNESAVGETLGRSARGMENTISINVSLGNTPENDLNFYSGEEVDSKTNALKDKIKEIKELRLKYKKVVFPSQLLSKEHRKSIKEGSNTFHKELKGQLEVAFEYKIAGETKKQKDKAIRKINAEAKKSAFYVDMGHSTAVIDIDIERGMGKRNKFDKDESFTLTKSQDDAVIRKTIEKARIDNTNYLKKKKFGIAWEIDRNAKTPLVEFPSIITIKVGNKIKYFQLVRVAGPLKQKGSISENNSVAKGTAAQYIEVVQKGSTAQFAGGFVGGRVVDSSIVRELVKEVNAEEKEEEEGGGKADEAPDMVAKRRSANQGSRTYNGVTGSIEFEDGNLNDVKIKETSEKSEDPGVDPAEIGTGEESTDVIITEKIFDEKSDEEIITNFWNGLTADQKAKIKKSTGATTVEQLIEGSKHPFYKNVKMFLSSIKECFL